MKKSVKSVKSAIPNIEWPTVTKSVIAVGSVVPGYTVHKTLRKAEVSPFITIPLGIATSLGLTILGCKIVDGVGSFVRVKTEKILPCDIKAIMDAIHDNGVKEYCDHYDIDAKASVRDIDIDDLVMFYDEVTDRMCEKFLTVKNESTIDPPDFKDIDPDNSEEDFEDDKKDEDGSGIIPTTPTVVDPHANGLD